MYKVWNLLGCRQFQTTHLLCLEIMPELVAGVAGNMFLTRWSPSLSLIVWCGIYMLLHCTIITETQRELMYICIYLVHDRCMVRPPSPCDDMFCQKSVRVIGIFLPKHMFPCFMFYKIAYEHLLILAMIWGGRSGKMWVWTDLAHIMLSERHLGSWSVFECLKLFSHMSLSLIWHDWRLISWWTSCF